MSTVNVPLTREVTVAVQLRGPAGPAGSGGGGGIPVSNADPVAPTDGYVYYNSALGEIRYYRNSDGWQQLLKVGDSVTTAERWETARTLLLDGDAAGQVSMDGSQDVTLTVTVAGLAAKANTTDLGSAAFTDAADYATAVQGALAASASQPGHGHTKADITDFNDDDYATGAEGDLAASAVQPGDVGTAAALNVAAAGDAAAGEVVTGDDTRLTDARAPLPHNHDGTYDPAGAAASAQTAAESTAAAALVAHHAPGSTDHDDRYYTEPEMDAALSGKADTGHDHAGTYEPAGAVTTHETSHAPADAITAGQHALIDHTGLPGVGAGGGPDPAGAAAGYVWTADGAGGADWQASAGGGGGTTTPTIGAQLEYRGANLPSETDLRPMTFDTTVVVDTGFTVDAAAGQITVPQSGFYAIHLRCRFSGTVTGTSVLLVTDVSDGSYVARGLQITSGVADLSEGWTVWVEAGTTLQALLYTSVSSAISTVSGERPAVFSAVLLGGGDPGPDATGATAGHVWTADGADGADWQAPPAGGGAVDSVNTQTGDVVLGAGDVGADPAGSAAAAQSAAEATAAAALAAHHAPASTDHDDRYTPTSSLAAVATTGAYSDLTGQPALGSAAATDTGDYATAAQGALADSAVQPGALGTAAPLDVAAAGDAAAGEVVKGDDTRLSDARTPTAHNHDGVYDPAGAAAAAQAAAESTAAGALAAHHDPTSADHDDRYYTEAEVDAALAGVPGEAPQDGQQYARQNGAWAVVLGGDTSGLLPKESLSADGTTADLDPSTEWVGRWDITDDLSPTAGWPDRLSFRFDGERTGWFNEYGEIRARSAKNATVAMKVHGRGATQTARIFQVAEDQGGAEILSVGRDPDVQVTNSSKDRFGLVVNRTEAATATDDPDIVQVQYLGTRRTWVNEKGMLRVGGVGADVRDEDTLKIVTDNTPGANAIVVVREDGTTVWRVGALGRVNYYFGQRVVGDTIQIRDATEADESTIEQETGGDLVITPKNDAVMPTPHGNLPLMPVWTGTQVQFDALTPDPGVMYVVTG